MQLTVLGCAGTFPALNAPCSSYLVEAEGFRLLLDFGPGSLSTMQKHIGLHDLDAIFLSHLHLDHIADAVSYAMARRYDPRGSLPLLPVYGPAGTIDRLSAIAGNLGTPPDVSDVYQHYPMIAGHHQIGPFSITAWLMNHPVETYGVQVVYNNKILAYTGDTGSCDAVAELARNADVFLCEASYQPVQDEKSPNLHLTPTTAGKYAQEAGVKHLILTHLVTAWGQVPSDVYQQAASVFGGNISLARSGEVIYL